MKLLRHYTLGILFGFILIFAILSYWCVGLRIDVERNINYYLSSNEHNVIIINHDLEPKPSQEPLFFIPKDQDLTHNQDLKSHHENEVLENPYQRHNFNMKSSFNRHSFLFPARNYSSNKTCKNCFNINFDFLIENDICTNDNYTLVYLIFTKYSNVAQRRALRETWLSDVKTSSGQTYVFVTGKGPQSDNFNIKNMIRENNDHNDILLVDFLDSYLNLTYKSIMAFKWVTRRCPNAEFVMKVDDDVWVHKPELIPTLRRKDFSLGGYCMFNSMPFRDKNSKYFASYESFPERVYPPFCSGTAYLTKIDVIQKILNISPNVPFFHLEDVYIALCLRELRISVANIRGFNAHKLMTSSCLNKSPFVITSHGLNPDEMRQVWRSQCNFKEWMGKGAANRIRQAYVNRDREPAVRNYVRMNANSNKMINSFHIQGPRPINSIKRRRGRQRQVPVMFPS
ncbi:beta-1,3-galactosyltransferase 5-like [Mizuhopecten yessoensis]|uniref:Hexosyltransferase n=1 Tax=Mizuhopecten yessoensis TaxID=6573 RepID=A0A210PM97_MIZYE|nr:beta-1,3-galactosyltransferase 5-like [Mizuhopecten yessoensis]OWF37601.1 Beta-1,3-galactosyltransferase 1 [Mizuhopecten yessoensis]